MATPPLLLLLFFLFNTVLSRHPPPPPTALLHLSAASRRTFSGHLKPATSSSSSSLFSLQLHPRPTKTHKDYKSLTLSRLHRDSLRATSILSQFYPSAAVAPAAGGNKTAPLSSGAAEGSGEYFAKIGVGTPPTMTSLVIDTGSDVTWLQCDPCRECYSQTDPIYLPSSSSSFSPLPCSSPLCNLLEVSGCRNSSCLYEVSYGDGSFTVGDFVTETLTLSAAVVAAVAVGCGHTNEGLFVGSAGVLGLGGGALSFTSQIKAGSLSYCLVDRDSDSVSTLEFGGGIPPTAIKAPLLKHSLLRSFYFVGLAGIVVGGRSVALPPACFALDEAAGGGVIVDSGTAVTRFPTAVYAAVREAFTAGMRGFTAAEGVALFDTCYDFSNSTTAGVEVPTVGFIFDGGGRWALPPENYLIPVDGAGRFCFAFAPTGSGMSIIGNVQQQRTRVSFDVAGGHVGFSVDEC